VCDSFRSERLALQRSMSRSLAVSPMPMRVRTKPAAEVFERLEAKYRAMVSNAE